MNNYLNLYAALLVLYLNVPSSSGTRIKLKRICMTENECCFVPLFYIYQKRGEKVYNNDNLVVGFAFGFELGSLISIVW